MNWGDLIPSVIGYPVKAYNNRHKIQELWKKVLTFTNLGATNILILGRTNVGKTIFLDTLNGKTNNPFYEKPESSKIADVEAIKIGDWHNLFRTAPGQESVDRDSTITEAFEKSDKLEGIIYITDWGYTNYRDKILSKKLIEEDDINSIKILRKRNLQSELEDFKIISAEIQKAFRNGKNISWLLIVVSKADLFYSEKELNRAEKYYHPLYTGKFSKLLKKLENIVGTDRLKIDAVPFCAFPEDFKWHNEVKKSKIGQRENQNNLIRNFYQKLIELQ